MDELRKVATPVPTYSEVERDILYRALVFFAKKVSDIGHDVIIDATGNLRRWRDLARSLIPRYGEVYLVCSREVCVERERGRVDSREAPRDVYLKGEQGWPVPGVNVPYEEPLHPELTIDTEHTSVQDAAEMIRKVLFSQLGSFM